MGLAIFVLCQAQAPCFAATLWIPDWNISILRKLVNRNFQKERAKEGAVCCPNGSLLGAIFKNRRFRIEREENDTQISRGYKPSAGVIGRT